MNKMTIFYGYFTCINDVIEEFELNDGDLADYKILLACYEVDGYQGEAFVLLEKDGKYFEVESGHCSCYGLEDSWMPHGITIEKLLDYLDCPYFKFKDQLRECLQLQGL